MNIINWRYLNLPRVRLEYDKRKAELNSWKAAVSNEVRVYQDFCDRNLILKNKEDELQRVEDALTIIVITLLVITISLLTFEINGGSKVVFTISLLALIARTVIHLDLRRTDVTFTRDG